MFWQMTDWPSWPARRDKSFAGALAYILPKMRLGSGVSKRRMLRSMGTTALKRAVFSRFSI
jgi:hypothetical protein